MFIQTGSEFVGNLLSRHIQFQVPEHQRDYAWTEDEILQFWDDVWSGCEQERSHFFGPIVLKDVKSGQIFEIIDGQQRLATCLILLAAIRNKFQEQNDLELSGAFQTAYFGELDRRTRQPKPKFRMNTSNDEVYSEFIGKFQPHQTILDKLRSRTTKHSSKRILESYVSLRQKIDEVAGSGASFNPEPLVSIEDFLRDRLSLIQIIVSDEADAYTLFETLNERGIELSVLDLLKNHLLKQAGASRDSVLRNWYETTSNLDENAGTKFLRHFWVSQNGRVQAGRLYREIRNTARTKADTIKLSDKLLADSRIYAALNLPDHDAWDKYPASVRDAIATLRLLNASQCFPILMAAYHRFDADDFDKVLRLMVVMAVRYSLICAFRTGAMEIAYADIAYRIATSGLKRPAGVRRELSSLYPSDNDFRTSFLTREIRTARHARFLLRELDIQASGGAVGAVDNTAMVNLEHVMPKAQNQYWRQIGNLGGEAYETWVYRIGNQTLVEKRINADLGAKGWAAKKDAFSRSQITLTREMAQLDSWTTDAIAKRQETLADLALNRWRYDV